MSRKHTRQASDILECAKKHPDFLKNDLYVTQHAIIKFLDIELKIPRKGMLGHTYFVANPKALRIRLAQEVCVAHARACCSLVLIVCVLQMCMIS